MSGTTLAGQRPERAAATAGPARVRPAARLRGELRMPGDKSISHRALMLAALAEGVTRIAASGDGADVRSTAEIARRLGVTVERIERIERIERVDRDKRDEAVGRGGRTDAANGGTVDYRVESPGADGLSEPSGILDCGNSGTSLRLFAGLLAGLPMTVTLDGDASLRRRPVARIIEPLRSMGAVLHARRNDSLPPVTVVGRTPLRAGDIAPAVPSAQVKSAILLAALRADGRTTFHESVATRDHTERMLRARGIPVGSRFGVDGTVTIEIEGGGRVLAVDEQVPGDVSAAAFWLVAAAIHPDAELTLRGVGVNPTRRRSIDLLRVMGADIDERATAAATDTPQSPDAARDDGVGEPIADLTARSSRLHGIEIGPRDVAAAIDEIPILCLAAAVADGTTVIRGAAELRHKESDRIAGIVAGLGALGARIEVDGDDLLIHGGTRLVGAPTDSLDDHRLAMTFAIAGLVAGGETLVRHPSSASVSYPGFFADLERVQA